MPDDSAEMGLLEKLLGPVPGTGAAFSVPWVGDPIRQHLILLLNTRRGSLLHMPDYGMPDVSSYYADYPASLTELRSEILQLIRKYEPRLENVDVKLLETDRKEFKVALLITGEIEEPAGVVKVSYRTTITSGGRTELEG
jgi:type VI secretion system protein